MTTVNSMGLCSLLVFLNQMEMKVAEMSDNLSIYREKWDKAIKKIQSFKVFEVRPGETYESHLMGGQFQFCVDLKKYKILQIRGLNAVLGYDESKFELDDIFDSNFFHPDQKNHFFSFYRTIFNIHNEGCFNSYENISFSFKLLLKHKNGKYLKFCVQSVVTLVGEDGSYAGGFFNAMNVSGMAGSLNFGWDISGEKEVVAAFKRKMKDELSSFLTKREFEVLRFLKDGYSSKMIADELGIAKNTVDNYRSSLLRKTSTGNSAQMISVAQRNGWI